jgi:hypothetical protein
MSDIVDELKQVLIEFDHEGARKDHQDYLAIVNAIREIEHLRAKIVLLHQIAGKASVEGGLSFSDIKKEIRK